MLRLKHYALGLLFLCPLIASAQTDSSSTDEDWDMYGNLDFADKGAKRFASSKVHPEVSARNFTAVESTHYLSTFAFMF